MSFSFNKAFEGTTVRRVRRGASIACSLLLTGSMLTCCAGQDSAAPSTLVRIGLTPGTWGGVNRNDASAAIAAWAKTIMKESGITLEVETRMFDSKDEMVLALRNNQIEAVTMLSDQLLSVEPPLQPDALFLTSRNQSITEKYVLLARRDKGIHDVPDLPGHKLLLQDTSRTSLAPVWLDALLASRSLGSIAQFQGTVQKIDSPSKAVLKVFFGQADASVVSASVFETACELNPQLRRELQILAVSPEVIPAVFFFRPGYDTAEKRRMEQAILKLHESPGGLQVLTIFQGERMEKRDLSCLEGTRQLLAQQKKPQTTVDLVTGGTLAAKDHPDEIQ